MVEPVQLRLYVVRVVLKAMYLWSQSAEELLMLTTATESHCGRWIKQDGGPAVGPYQMEPNTHQDIWLNYLKYHNELAAKAMAWRTQADDHTISAWDEMAGNWYYATAMCRIHYYRVKEPLPLANDITGLAKYYKKYFNTELGKSTITKAMKDYDIYVTRG